jgi:hypothetical protein
MPVPGPSWWEKRRRRMKTPETGMPSWKDRPTPSPIPQLGAWWAGLDKDGDYLVPRRQPRTESPMHTRKG